MEPEAIQRCRCGVNDDDVLAICTRDDIAVLLAEYERLRAIEAAAREFWNDPWAGNFGKLRAALAAKETP
jgi:hypothetical protein